MSRVNYNHIHCYKAVNTARRVYKCIVLGCVHSINASLMPGRNAQCPECNESLVITSEHLRRVNITCIGCGVVAGPKKLPSKEVVGVTESVVPSAAPLKPLDVNSLLDKVRKSL